MLVNSLWSIPWAVLWISLRSVGTAATMVTVGVLLARKGVLDSSARKALSEISMKATIPALLFTKMLHCEQCGTSDGMRPEGCARCRPLLEVISQGWVLLFLPLFVVPLGMLLGKAVSKATGCPPSFANGCVAACAFGNSTGMPIVLLTVVKDMFSELNEGELSEVDPLMFLSIYLILYPILQWSMGGWLLGLHGGPVCKGFLANNRNVSQGGLADWSRRGSKGSLAEQLATDALHKATSDASLSELTELHMLLPGAGGDLLSVRQATERSQATSGDGSDSDGEGLWCAQDSCSCRCGEPCHVVVENALVPPVLAVLAGVAFGTLSPLRQMLVDIEDQNGDAVMQWLFNGLQTLGQAAVPVNLLILGSNLSRGVDWSALPAKTCAAIVFCKMLLMPSLMAMTVFGLAHYLDVPHPNDTSLWLVALVVTCTPTANNIMVMVELGGENKEAMATAIFVQYALAPILLTLSLSAFIVLLRAPWFLPGEHGSWS